MEKFNQIVSFSYRKKIVRKELDIVSAFELFFTMTTFTSLLLHCTLFTIVLHYSNNLLSFSVIFVDIYLKDFRSRHKAGQCRGKSG